MWEGGLEILAYEHFSPVTGMKAWWILASRMASSRIAYNIFHFISILFNCSDTASKAAKAMIVTSSQRPLISTIELCHETYKINDFSR